MSVLSVYVSGISTKGIELINEAVSETFGECNVVEVDRDKLRYKVRLGFRDSSVVLIILDSVSMDDCKDIAGGNFETNSKFYKYTNDKELAIYLNELYGLSLDIPDDDTDLSIYQIHDSSNSTEDLSDIVEGYESKIKDRDSIIKNMGIRIMELEKIVSEGNYISDDNSDDLESKVSELSSENLSLRDEVSTKNAEIARVNDLLKGKSDEIESLNGKVGEIQQLLNSLRDELKSVKDELSQERVSSSKKSGIIREKDNTISSLNEKLQDYNVISGENKDLKNKNQDLESRLRKLEATISTLQSTITSNKEEIVRLTNELDEIGVTSDDLKRYKGLLSTANSKIDELNTSLNDLQSDYDNLLSEYNKLKSGYDSLLIKYNKLSDDYTESEGFVAKLNIEKIALQDRISYLEGHTDVHVSDDANSILSELNDLRKKYADMQGNIFNFISMRSLPRSGIKVPIFKGLPDRYKNIKFQYSGSIESRKGTYKCLFNECIAANTDRFLIVDITSETYLDYVFQMRSIVDGLEWFTSGGGVQKYLSSTCLPNVKVLMPKVGYLNDSYFLTLNWENRLDELESSGYKVILYCGDISNLVGRVLFESFTDVGYSSVYVKGNAIGSRSIIANSGGLTGIKSSVIGYFDFDKSMLRFYEVMNKKAKCKIISYATKVGG